jgi:hypothetical protein
MTNRMSTACTIQHNCQSYRHCSTMTSRGSVWPRPVHLRGLQSRSNDFLWMFLTLLPSVLAPPGHPITSSIEKNLNDSNFAILKKNLTIFLPILPFWTRFLRIRYDSYKNRVPSKIESLIFHHRLVNYIRFSISQHSCVFKGQFVCSVHGRVFSNHVISYLTRPSCVSSILPRIGF